MARYPTLVEWDGNAGVYGAVFPDLDIGAVGSTLGDVLGNAKEMLRDYVMEMEKRGWPVSKPSPPHGIAVPTGNALVSISITLPSTLAT